MEDTKLRKCGPNDCCKKNDIQFIGFFLGPMCSFSSCLRTILKASKAEKPAEPAGSQSKPKAKAKATAAKTKAKRKVPPADDDKEEPPAPIKKTKKPRKSKVEWGQVFFWGFQNWIKQLTSFSKFGGHLCFRSIVWNYRYLCSLHRGSGTKTKN